MIPWISLKIVKFTPERKKNRFFSGLGSSFVCLKNNLYLMKGSLTNTHPVIYPIRKHFEDQQLNYRSIKESQ